MITMVIMIPKYCEVTRLMSIFVGRIVVPPTMGAI